MKVFDSGVCDTDLRCHIGALNSCLYRVEVDLSVDSNRAIKSQVSATWVQNLMGMFYTHKLNHKFHSHI